MSERAIGSVAELAAARTPVLDSRRIGRIALLGAAAVGYAFILTPIFFVCWLSFFANEIVTFPPQGYTLRWFAHIFDQNNFVSGFVTSLQVGIAAMIGEEGEDIEVVEEKEEEGSALAAQVDDAPVVKLINGILTDAVLKGQTAASSYKPAMLENGLRIMVPPFPYTDPETFAKTSKDAVIIFKKPTRDGVHIEDVKQINNEWVVTGTSGVVLIVVGTGTTMKAAQKQAYNRIENIMIPNMYYRMDIGDRWFEDFDRLHTWGYLRP